MASRKCTECFRLFVMPYFLEFLPCKALQRSQAPILPSPPQPSILPCLCSAIVELVGTVALHIGGWMGLGGV